MINKSSSEQDFVFIVNGKEYKCNINGVNSSKVIRELREKDPNIYHYNYDCNDDNQDFEIICNYFKTYTFKFKTNNMRSLLQIVEDLQIENILDDVHYFVNTYEKMVDKSEFVTEIFHQLYNIKDFTVTKVKDYIMKSKWLKSHEKIQELAAFILQVARTSYKCQPYILDLLILLDESSNENINLEKLLPFIVDRTLDTFYKTPFLCSFIFKMTKRGILSIDKIINKIRFLDPEFKILERNHLNNISIWFFPELIETNDYTIENILNKIDNNKANYIRLYYPDQIDLYKQIRDTGEPDDDLMRSVLHDDIETFQSIISKNHIEINSQTIFWFLYEDFDENIKKSYVNYAAENGSLKCFKYLLLNHASIDDLTFQCAITGGNTEIIRIVDNLIANKTYTNSPTIVNSIVKAIETHNYDIFDWLFENKINTNKPYSENISRYIRVAANNGNIRSLIKFADCINLYDNYYYYFYNNISYSSKLGFYQMTKFLLFLNGHTCHTEEMSSSSIEFGNLSIFKIFANGINVNWYYKEDLLVKAIQKNYLHIVRYIIEEVYIHFNGDSFKKMYSNSLKLETPDVFNYLQSKFSFQYLKEYFLYDSKEFFSILYEGCPFGNMENVQKTTDFIIYNYHEIDFTDLLIRICKSNLEDICLYFLEKKVQFNFITVMQNYKIFLFKNGKVALKLIELAPPTMKFALSQHFLNESIQVKNYKIAKLLLNDKCFNNKILFAAVQSREIEFVDKVLLINKRPSFVNQISKNGTALNIAVNNNDAQIVKRLLDVPGIDVNSSKLEDGDTPLIFSIKNKNIEIIRYLLENQNTNINIRNAKQETALTIAVENQLEDVISLLINNPNFDADESNIDYAFFISNDSISMQLYQTNKVNVNFFLIQNSLVELHILETALIHAIRQYQLEKIDLIINDDHFDPIESQINEAIVLSLYTNQINIFRKLYNFLKNNNKNLFLFVNEFLFNSILINRKTEIIEEILILEELEIDEKYIYELFLNSPLEIMKKILQYDEIHHHYINFDQLLPNGQSFFTHISDKCNEISNITQFFLDKNVDPNKADKYNIYPLEHAINENSIDMVKTLINSGKIDFTMRKKETEETYLHLAVHCSNQEIVNEIFNQNKVIADSINKYGETPILKAINISKLSNAAIINREDGDETIEEEINDKTINLYFKEALQYLKKETEKGDPLNTVKYGMMYELGIGIPVDKKEACKYYKMAADKNHFLGLHFYGYALAHGVGTNVDYKEACKYFKKGIKKGCIYSMIHYGYMLDNGFGVSINHDEANSYYDSIAQNDSLCEINRFAEFFETDTFFPVNLSEACRYYKISADRGDKTAMKKFAHMLENGIGIQKDVEKAKTYYKMAEEKKQEERTPLLF